MSFLSILEPLVVDLDRVREAEEVAETVRGLGLAREGCDLTVIFRRNQAWAQLLGGIGPQGVPMPAVLRVQGAAALWGAPGAAASNRAGPERLGLMVAAPGDGEASDGEGVDPAAGREFRHQIDRLVEAMLERGTLDPAIPGDQRFGLFIDYLTKLWAGLPAADRAGFLKDLPSRLATLWHEFTEKRPAPAVASGPGPATARPPVPAAHGASDERWLRDRIDPARLEPLLRGRRRQEAGERFDVSPQAPRMRFMHEAARRVGATWNTGVTTTVEFRYATMLRWIAEQSPLKGRTDLSVFGVGIRLMPLPLPGNRHSPLFSELLEILAVLAREGSVRYLDLVSQTVEAVGQFRRTGRMLVSSVAEDGFLLGKATEALRSPVGSVVLAMMGHSADGQRRVQSEGYHTNDIPWVVAEMRAAGVQIQNYQANTRAVRASSELIFPTALAERLDAVSGDLVLDPLPRGSADFAPALTTFLYVPPDLREMAIVRWAGVPRPGGLLAVTNAETRGEDRVLTALGFERLVVLKNLDPPNKTTVYRRPDHPLPLLDELIAAMEDLLREIRTG